MVAGIFFLRKFSCSFFFLVPFFLSLLFSLMMIFLPLLPATGGRGGGWESSFGLYNPTYIRLDSVTSHVHAFHCQYFHLFIISWCPFEFLSSYILCISLSVSLYSSLSFHFTSPICIFSCSFLFLCVIFIWL